MRSGPGYSRIEASQFGLRETAYRAGMIDAQNTSAVKGELGSVLRKLICVVDDDVDVLKSLRFLLETEGFDVRTFRSGSALLGSRARGEADCLIIDYKMAGIDGLELTHRLRDLDIRRGAEN